MKKTYYLLFLLFFTSCSDLLDVEADNTISGNVIVDDISANNVLQGAYFNLFGIYDGSDGGELLGGDFKLIATLLARHDGQEISWQSEIFPDYTRFAQKSYTNLNPRIEANWLKGYETINIVNYILDNLDAISNSNSREEIEGQCLGIRGILYFELVRLWAPQYIGSNIPGLNSNLDELAIPLILNSINSTTDIEPIVLSTIGQVYSQVNQDLEAASSLLENKSIPKNRISYYAVESYLGKVAMQQSEYQIAVNHFNNVINGPFNLMENPLDAFNNNNAVAEDILVITQTNVSNTGNLTSATGLAPVFSFLSETGFGALQIIESTFNFGRTFLPNNAKFYREDLRHSIDTTVTSSSSPNNIDSAFYRTNVNLSSSKYLRSTDVIPVIRLAEILLARAEAIHEIVFASPIDPTALSDINRIRERAGIPTLDNTLSEFQFIDSIRVEKNRELIYEGLVFHDLKRWRLLDNSVEVFRNINPLNLILPIPQAECLASPGLCD